jgi:glycerate dehydrogenase
MALKDYLLFPPGRIGNTPVKFFLCASESLRLFSERLSMPKPNIVILDGFTLNPGDLSWKRLESLGPCTIYDRSAQGEVFGRSREAEILLTNKTVLDRAAILALPRLRYIGVMATGYNIVDIAAARERKVPVTNVPVYGTNSVAQMTFALLLELARGVGHHARTVREGRWSSSTDFCYWDTPQIELDGLTMGIVGYGRIGREAARIARVFHMRVMAYDTGRPAPEPGVSFVPLDDLFRLSDIVSLHCPLTPETREMVNARTLALMKSTAFLLNSSRGPLVNEYDLAEALNAGNIAGAALDVLPGEPPPAESPLIGARNCIITPHIAWATLAARRRLMDTAIENVQAFLRGEPENVVN